MPLDVEGDRDEAVDAAAVMREHLHIERGRRGLPVHLLGQSALWAGIQELSKEDLEQAEIIGLPIVLIILLFVFGSLAAAALPLALGVASVVRHRRDRVLPLADRWRCRSSSPTWPRCSASAWRWTTRCSSSPATARSSSTGWRPREAREVAMRTSGMAVTFSGVTVIVALAGLFLIDAKVVQLDGGRRDRRRRRSPCSPRSRCCPR